MFCHKCGTEVADGAAFCHKCGAQLHQDEGTQNWSDTDFRVDDDFNDDDDDADWFDHYDWKDWLKEWFEERLDKFKTMPAAGKVLILLLAGFAAWILAVLLLSDSPDASTLLLIMVVGGCIVYYKWGLNYITEYVYNKKSKKLQLPAGMTAQTLLGELNGKLNYPYFKGIRYGKSGECIIEGKYSVYPVTFNKNGIARLSYKHPDHDEKIRVVMLEAIAVRSYVNKFFNPNLRVDAAEDLKTLQAAEKQHRTTSLVVATVAVVLTVVIALAYAAPGTLQRIVKPGVEVRTAYLSQYSDTITVEDAFDNFFDNGKWSTYKDKDYSYVAFTGACEYLGERADVKVTFKITGERFSVDSLDINGQEQNNLILYALLSKVYEDY